MEKGRVTVLGAPTSLSTKITKGSGQCGTHRLTTEGIHAGKGQSTRESQQMTVALLPYRP